MRRPPDRCDTASQEISQADAARKYGIDVSVIIRLRALAKDAALAAFASAKPGRPASVQDVELEPLRAENDRLSEALKEMAVELTLHRGSNARAFRPGPARVSAETKLELLGLLIDSAVRDGWAQTRACQVLNLADVRAHRWRQRLRETGSLEDSRPVGEAVHRLLASEEQAILDLIEQWGWVDRSHRKLAHRGSYTGVVFVSPSTLLRVALKNQVTLPGEPFRPRPVIPALPEIPWEKNRIWIWDCSHFTRAKRVAYAIVDVVTRYWIGYLLTTEQTSTQAQLLFARALEDQDLLSPDGLPPERGPEDPPILVAWSDNGSEMTGIDSRQFMALMAITPHHGRPGTPTDQAHIESFFSHLKGDWPHLTQLTDAAALDAELGRIGAEYNTMAAARRDRVRHPR